MLRKGESMIAKSLGIFLGLLVAFFGLSISGDAIAAPEDEVLAVFARNAEGWEKFDAEEVASTYAADATWQNPFGVRLEGPSQIKEFLVHLFARPGYRSGKDVAPLKVQRVRMLGSDSAVMWSEESSTGQIENGKPLGNRHSHYLQVFHRNSSGWKITDDMIMDERELPH
jgi:uncharacterized protein (TIGR02246 family)